MGTVFDFETKQIHFPDKGYDAPKRTASKCANPAFADENLHRVGIFLGDYDDDGLPGYHLGKKCVNCGLQFDGSFLPSKRQPNNKIEFR